MTATRWLASLVRHLRDAGLTVPPARLLDAAQALVVAGDEVTERDMLQTVLRITLAQRRDERLSFDRVFGAFMAAHGPPRPHKKSRPRASPGAADRQTGQGQSSGQPEFGATRLNPISDREFGSSRLAPISDGEFGSSRVAPISDREFGSSRLAPNSGSDEVPLDASAELLLAWAHAWADGADEKTPTPAAVAKAPHDLRGPSPSTRHPRHAGKASDKGVGQHEAPLTAEAETRMLTTLRRMANALWLRRSRRTRRFKSGRVDMKGTLARAFRTDAMAFRLMRRRRRLKRARLLLLLDVSGSMRRAASFVLALAQGMREAFVTVGVLAFVDHPIDVTYALRGTLTDSPGPASLAAGQAHHAAGQSTHPGGQSTHPGGQAHHSAGQAHHSAGQATHAAERAPTAADINWMSQSDYGNTFFKLLTEHERMLRKDVLLVVVGDARNNFGDAMPWALAEVRARVGWLLWLNPEARKRWNTGDSVVETYAPWCDRLLRCASMADLREASEALLHRAAHWR